MSGKFWKNWVGRDWTEVILTSLILFATAINAAATIVYVSIYYRSSQEVGRQTDKLICAANLQAKSARDLVEAAKQQASEMKALSAQATEQAKATNILAAQAARQANIARDAINSNIELSREDRRAWVGLQGFQCPGCTVDRTTWSIEIRDFSGVLVNTGKTPALKMTVQTVFMNAKRSDPIPAGGLPFALFAKGGLFRFYATHFIASFLRFFAQSNR